MFRIGACLAAMLLAVSVHGVSAQTTTALAPEAKPSRMKLTAEKLKEIKAKWTANKPRLKVCRKEVKAVGLIGDDRWFYIEDCMSKG
jgi:hypothetical protein